MQEQLDLRESASAWWDAHEEYAFAHRLIRYLREVALVERPERLVLFVDEIDTTLRLDFTDDFFAAIRFLYQNRALDAELERISFVLIGVATPNDLIKDAARTPFNIGRRIELTDFTGQEAAVLAVHLAVPPDAAGDFIDAILRWTSGHPYLTMRAIRSLAETPPSAWSTTAVDARVRELFLGPGGEGDTNLQFVRDMLTKKAFNREAVLAAYDAIRSGASVPDKELDQVASWLKLSGIVRRQDGLLRVRNAIYEQVFDQRWARVHRRLHINWRRRLARAAAALLVLIVLVTIPLALYAMRQRNVADGARRQAEAQRDEAQRQRANAETQRDLAEQQLLTTEQNLQTAQEAVAALKEFDPKAAAQLSAELTTARTTADQQLAALTQERERLRKDRDDAQAQVRKLEQENAALKQPQSRPPAAAAPRHRRAVRRAEPRRTADRRARPVGGVRCAGHRREGRRQRSAPRYDRRPTAGSRHRGCARHGPESVGVGRPSAACVTSDRRERDGRHRPGIAHASALQGGVRGARRQGGGGGLSRGQRLQPAGGVQRVLEDDLRPQGRRRRRGDRRRRTDGIGQCVRDDTAGHEVRTRRTADRNCPLPAEEDWRGLDHSKREVRRAQVAARSFSDRARPRGREGPLIPYAHGTCAGC